MPKAALSKMFRPTMSPQRSKRPGRQAGPVTRARRRAAAAPKHKAGDAGVAEGADVTAANVTTSRYSQKQDPQFRALANSLVSMIRPNKLPRLQSPPTPQWVETVKTIGAESAGAVAAIATGVGAVVRMAGRIAVPVATWPTYALNHQFKTRLTARLRGKSFRRLTLNLWKRLPFRRRRHASGSRHNQHAPRL
jgi:hypothetical protein